MGTNDPLCKEMLSKLKEAFSLKTFSSKSYQSSLISNSKIIRLEASLVEGVISTSDKALSCSNFTSKNFGKVPKMNEKFRIKCDRKSNNTVSKKESVCSSRSKIEIKKEPMISEKEKLELKISVNYSYQTKSDDLLKHVETEAKQDCSDFKSFRCDVCLKYYSSQRSVRRHRVLHSSEKHPCETCGKIFRTKETLKRHSEVVHKLKSINCSKCSKVFSRKAGLNVHLKKNPNHVQRISTITVFSK